MMIPLCTEHIPCWIIASILPGLENRIGIPLAIIGGIPIHLAVILSSLLSAMAGIATFYILKVLEELGLARLLPIHWVRKRFEPYRRYGKLALPLFVAVPLPGSGAYTGALAAFLVGLNERETAAGLLLGTLLAGIIVGALAGGLTALVALQSLPSP